MFDELICQREFHRGELNKGLMRRFLTDVLAINDDVITVNIPPELKGALQAVGNNPAPSSANCFEFYNSSTVVSLDAWVCDIDISCDSLLYSVNILITAQNWSLRCRWDAKWRFLWFWSRGCIYTGEGWSHPVLRLDRAETKSEKNGGSNAKSLSSICDVMCDSSWALYTSVSQCLVIFYWTAENPCFEKINSSFQHLRSIPMIWVSKLFVKF